MFTFVNNTSVYNVHFVLHTSCRGKKGYTCFIDLKPVDPRVKTYSRISTGESKCKKGDVFDSLVGRRMALHRALTNGGFDRATKVEVINYFYEKSRKPTLAWLQLLKTS
jgi:hypothetical protein